MLRFYKKQTTASYETVVEIMTNLVFYLKSTNQSETSIAALQPPREQMFLIDF